MVESRLVTTLFILLIVACQETTPKQEQNKIETPVVVEEKPKPIEVKGEYINSENGLYQKIDIRGETTCIITDGVFGLTFPTQYIRDGVLSSVKTDQSDLLFTIVHSDTLIGEGFSEGIYIKSKK